jgi:uncharacterized membrane protein YeaQ/YmgE (transglycosylase-associated protein family)
MTQAIKTHRTARAVLLCSLGALDAYGRTSSLTSVTGLSVETMSFLSWVVLGLIAGFIGSKITNGRGEGMVLDILLGIVGAFVGGWLFRVFGAAGVSGLNLYSVFVAVTGSVVFLVLYHALRRTRSW